MDPEWTRGKEKGLLHLHMGKASSGIQDVYAMFKPKRKKKIKSLMSIVKSFCHCFKDY